MTKVAADEKVNKAQLVSNQMIELLQPFNVCGCSFSVVFSWIDFLSNMETI